jgi:hypothetical protein
VITDQISFTAFNRRLNPAARIWNIDRLGIQPSGNRIGIVFQQTTDHMMLFIKNDQRITQRLKTRNFELVLRLRLHGDITQSSAKMRTSAKNGLTAAELKTEFTAGFKTRVACI